MLHAKWYTKQCQTNHDGGQARSTFKTNTGKEACEVGRRQGPEEGEEKEGKIEKDSQGEEEETIDMKIVTWTGREGVNIQR